MNSNYPPDDEGRRWNGPYGPINQQNYPMYDQYGHRIYYPQNGGYYYPSGQRPSTSHSANDRAPNSGSYPQQGGNGYPPYDYSNPPRSPNMPNQYPPGSPQIPGQYPPGWPDGTYRYPPSPRPSYPESETDTARDSLDSGARSSVEDARIPEPNYVYRSPVTTDSDAGTASTTSRPSTVSTTRLGGRDLPPPPTTVPVEPVPRPSGRRRRRERPLTKREKFMLWTLT